MRMTIPTLALACTCMLWADTVELRDGRIVKGTYLGGDSRQIRMETGDLIEIFPVTDVRSLRFEQDSEMQLKRRAPVTQPAESATGSNPVSEAAETQQPAAPLPASTPPPTAAAATAPAAAPTSAAPRMPAAPPAVAPRPTPAPSSTPGLEVPAGTAVVIRMIDPVDSQNASIGQKFAATVDDAIAGGGRTLIPKGAEVVVKLIEDTESGKLTGKTELALALESIRVDGRTLEVAADEVRRQSGSRSRKSAVVIGGATALGTIVGAIAGGGAGAAIGAVSGAGAGAAIQVFSKGQRVRIPSETRLSFTLQDPLRL